MDQGEDIDAGTLNRKASQQTLLAPTDDGPKRRTWEGYAEDYHALSEKLVDESRRQQDTLAVVKALEAQIQVKEAQFATLKAQRGRDLERLAAVSRTRDLLEKRSAAQMARVAAALARPVHEPVKLEEESTADPEPVVIEAVIEVNEEPTVVAPEPAQATGFAAHFEGHDETTFGWADRRLWRAMIKAAQTAHQQGRLERAILLYQAVIERQQVDDLWVQLGHVLRESGQFLDAEMSYRRALAIRPGQGELLFLSGYCFEMAGQVDKAAPLYEAALASDPTLVERFEHLRDFRTRLER